MKNLKTISRLCGFALVGTMLTMLLVGSVSAQSDAGCAAPSAPVNVGIGSDGLALQISWERGDGDAPDGYWVAVARSGIGSKRYYEILHGNDPWIEPYSYLGWDPIQVPVWMMIDAGSATELTFTAHTFVNHKGVEVTAALDEGRQYTVHVAAKNGGCYSSWTQQAVTTARTDGSPPILPPNDLRYAGYGKVAYTPRSGNAEHQVEIVEARFVASNIEAGTDCLLPWSWVNGNDLTQWEGNEWIPWYSDGWDGETHFFVRVLVYTRDDAGWWQDWTHSQWVLVEKGMEPTPGPSPASPPTTPLAP